MNCRKCKRETPSDALYCPYCGVSLQPKKNTRKPRTRPNGTGTAFKRGKTWTAQITIGWQDGKQRYRTKGGFSTRREALEYCSQLKVLPKQKPKLTFQAIYDMWLPTHENRVSHSTINCYKAAYKYFAPLYNLPFADIDVDALQECLDDSGKGKRTKENMKALAGLLMKFAIPRHQTDMNYAEFLHTGNDAKSTRPAFTKEQVEAIKGQIGVTPYAEYVYVLIYTGFRPSEMFNLTQKDYVNAVLYGGAKTRAGKGRAVPVSSLIRPYIGEKTEKNSIWLFPRDDGSQMTVNYFRDNYFYQVLANAGIQHLPTQENPAYYTPYSCRHTFANMLKYAQGSDKDKAALIGHEDYTTTKKHYQSAELEALKTIIESI